MVEEKAKSGVFLSVLGFGRGNLNDAMMETISNKGNGNYAYIDSLLEAKKVLVHDMRKTLFTIAKNVKLQVEFNPARVASYRLIGYENRLLRKEDFRDDRKDAGEMGAGHTVTAFYEIIPAEGKKGQGQALKYQDARIRPSAMRSRDLLTVHVRYQEPEGGAGKEFSAILKDGSRSIEEASRSMRFASSVAEFGLLLRQSPHRGQASWARLIQRARQALGEDAFGYRHEFVQLAELAELLSPPDPKEQASVLQELEQQMVRIPGGTFEMGSTSSEADGDEQPVHRVTLSPFFMSRTEVTQRLWKAVMGSNPSYFRKGDSYPVEQVSWNDVQTFIQKLNQQTGERYRLPTEAEWEYAARGGTTGDRYGDLDRIAWYDKNAGGSTHPVGQKEPNAYGLYDMLGNVYEWCSDWYGTYSSSSQTNPQGPDKGSGRVERGGSWFFSAGFARAGNRHGVAPSFSYSFLGFRLSMDAPRGRR